MGDAASSDPNELVGALERFVVGNDDLRELEDRIGRFNVFEALRLARVEIRHSNFLAWILDPGEAHGQGGGFLKALLMDLLAGTPPELRPFSPIELDGTEFSGVEVLREHRGIDVLIKGTSPSFVIAIENKIDSGEHGDQLARYEQVVHETFGDVPRQFVYLTIDGAEPSSETWVPYTYADIHRVFDQTRRANEATIGDDVAVFLDHYLSLIKSRFMDDEKIDELCRRIYKNHRRALDLIVERAGATGGEMLDSLAEALRAQPERWHVFNVTSRRVDFVRADWKTLLPPIAARGVEPRYWIKIMIYIRKNVCRLYVDATRTTDIGLRERVVARLIKNKDEFGLRVVRKEKGARWNRLLNVKIAGWSEEEDPDIDDALRAAAKKLDDLYARTDGVARALTPLVEEWEASQ
jgi:hypothetical protein